MFGLLKRLLLYPLVLLFILFEELIYRKFIGPVFAIIRQWALIRRFNDYIGQQSRYVILVMFLSFFTVAEVLGFVSLALLASAQVLMGVIFYLVKTLLALYSFMLLELHKEKLFSFLWFSFVYKKIISFVHFVKASSIYREIASTANKIKLAFRREKRSDIRIVKKLYNYIKSRR